MSVDESSPRLQRTSFSFFDSDALKHAVKGSNFRLQQIGRGAFEAELHTARIGAGILDRAHYSRALLNQGAFSSDYMLFGCVLKSERPGIINGQEVHTHDMILSDQGAALEYLSSDDTDWTTLQFKRKDLQRLGVVSSRQGHVYHIRGTEQGAKRIQAILRSIEKGSTAHLDGEMVYNYLLSLYAKQVDSTEDLSSIESRQIARQLYHYINANAYRALQMIDLTTLTGKSERTLERVFKHHFGLTPYSYLKVHRLNLIRRRLLAKSKGNSPETIAQIATELGFIQMGYFCGEYKRLFGETPSETLEKE